MMRCQCNGSAGYDAADTSLTLARWYNTKPRETPDHRFRLTQAESATYGNALKPVGTDS